MLRGLALLALELEDPLDDGLGRLAPSDQRTPALAALGCAAPPARPYPSPLGSPPSRAVLSFRLTIYAALPSRDVTCVLVVG